MKAGLIRNEKGACTMWHFKAAAVVVSLMFAGLQLVVPRAAADSPAPPIPETQAVLKRLGFGISQITLPPKAASRLGIETAQISEDPSGRKVAPFSSIIYDLDGDAWVYTVPARWTFVRKPVVVELITRDRAYLKEGPETGTQVVTVGVPELYGTEVGVNGE
jgi:hypothetical protein